MQLPLNPIRGCSQPQQTCSKHSPCTTSEYVFVAEATELSALQVYDAAESAFETFLMTREPSAAVERRSLDIGRSLTSTSFAELRTIGSLSYQSMEFVKIFRIHNQFSTKLRIKK